MATDERKKQKALAKKKLKRKLKQKTQTELTNQMKTLTLTKALIEKEQAPIYQAWLRNADDFFMQGMGSAIIARELANGELSVAVFLMDSFCLGAKDGFIRNMTYEEYNHAIEQLQANEGIIEKPAPCVAKFILENIAYAENLGLETAQDAKKALLTLHNIDITTCNENYTFGKDGKPLFITGPYDDEAKVNKIIATLEKSVGSDNFLFHDIRPQE